MRTNDPNIIARDGHGSGELGLRVIHYPTRPSRVCEDGIHWPSIKVVGLVDQIGWSGTVGLGGLYFLHNSKSQQQRITNTQPNHQYITKNTKYTQNITNIGHRFQEREKRERERERAKLVGGDSLVWAWLQEKGESEMRENEIVGWWRQRIWEWEIGSMRNEREIMRRCAQIVVWEWRWDRETAVWLDLAAWRYGG